MARAMGQMSIEALQNGCLKWRVLYLLHPFQMGTRQHQLVASQVININDGSPLLLFFFNAQNGGGLSHKVKDDLLDCERAAINQTDLK